VHIADEMLHFVVGKVEPLEFALHRTFYFSELGLVHHIRSPTQTKLMLNPFQFPKE